MAGSPLWNWYEVLVGERGCGGLPYMIFGVWSVGAIGAGVGLSNMI